MLSMVPSELTLILGVTQTAQEKHRKGLGASDSSELNLSEEKVESRRRGKPPTKRDKTKLTLSTLPI